MTEGALTHQNLCFEAQRRVNRAALNFLLNESDRWHDIKSVQHSIESYIHDADQKNSGHALQTIHNKLSVGCERADLEDTVKVIFANLKQTVEALRPELIPQPAAPAAPVAGA
jgi:hypothetical protein